MIRRHFLTTVLAGTVAATLTRCPDARAQRDTTASRTRATRMEDGRPSLTAQSAAQLRAAHQLLDHPRVLDDPLALRIIGTSAETLVRANPRGEPGFSGLRAFVALRSRYAEDEMVRALHRGVRQYVILGAGLDTFAYRNPYRAWGLRVFEVDHPSTQAWKRTRLAETGIAIPDSLAFAPVDFERETLADGLRRAGLRSDEPAFFSLLGVVIYLTRDAFMETLKFVAARPSGSAIVFDYSLPTAALSDSERATRNALARRVAALGEPWITFFDPAELADAVRHVGFTRVENLGPQEARERYFKDRNDGLRPGGVTQLMKAGL